MPMRMLARQPPNSDREPVAARSPQAALFPGPAGTPRWVPRPARAELGRPLGGVTTAGEERGRAGSARRRALRGRVAAADRRPGRAAERAAAVAAGRARRRAGLGAPGPAGSAGASSVRPAAGGRNGVDKERHLGGRSAAAAPGPAPLPSGLGVRCAESSHRFYSYQCYSSSYFSAVF
ncbi:myosin IC heavy chain-like [Phodopus roborovskii]|uniref:myosin IC heavy chain-like n=1 Tax=Phodopus roborovskii TaxID=109678 RepID=UPI0021E38B4C|nr:myosin IC heavy chain-like [Phodopus roborovskii]